MITKDLIQNTTYNSPSTPNSNRLCADRWNGRHEPVTIQYTQYTNTYRVRIANIATLIVYYYLLN